MDPSPGGRAARKAPGLCRGEGTVRRQDWRAGGKAQEQDQGAYGQSPRSRRVPEGCAGGRGLHGAGPRMGPPAGVRWAPASGCGARASRRAWAAWGQSRPPPACAAGIPPPSCRQARQGRPGVDADADLKRLPPGRHGAPSTGRCWRPHCPCRRRREGWTRGHRVLVPKPR